jgi:hypothetical protein
MAKKIKSLKQKTNATTFSETIPIGVDAENVDFSENGKYVYNLVERMQNVQNQINNKSPKSHASKVSEYGLGDDEHYGHLKITDEYMKTVDDSSNTAISQNGVVNMFNKYLLSILKVFYIVDDVILFSCLNTGWKINDNTLELIPEYFNFIQETDGNYILMVKDVTNQRAIDSPFDVVGEELRVYSSDVGWAMTNYKIRLVSTENVSMNVDTIVSSEDGTKHLALIINN